MNGFLKVYGLYQPYLSLKVLIQPNVALPFLFLAHSLTSSLSVWSQRGMNFSGWSMTYWYAVRLFSIGVFGFSMTFSM